MNIECTTIYINEPNQGIPNNPLFPLLIYRKAFADDSSEQKIKSAFKNNWWIGSWVNGVYDYHHYHSTAHEVLAVLSGTATIIFGGPGGNETQLLQGDVVVIPAGVGHCRRDSSPNFKVLGAYPQGQENYDLCTQKDDPQKKAVNIMKVPKPTKDPVLGGDGPLIKFWKIR